MVSAESSTRRNVPAVVALLAAASAGIGIDIWFVASEFIPLAYSDRPLEYIFLGAPVLLLAGATVAASALLAAIHLASFRPAARRWARASAGYLVPLALLGIAPAGALPLAAAAPSVFAVVSYVLVDLRWWWTAALLAVAVARFDRARGNSWRARLAVRAAGVLPRQRTAAAEAALFGLVTIFAIGSNAYLRFTWVLHGDEPKYLRLAENLYQGLGLDVAHQRTMEDLSLGYSPPLWRNASLLVGAVKQDAAYLLEDARTFLAHGFSAPYNRGEFVEGWFVRGRNGGFYQVHNPGLSFLLLPAYFADRHFISSSAGYQGVFPTSLPVTNLFFLLVWSLWAVLIFRLLRTCLGEPRLAWVLAATAMLTMPVSAFAFQIYPETIAGAIVTAVCVWLFGGRLATSRAWMVIGAGLAVGFLPWLHVRFLVMSLALAGWVVAALPRRSRRVVFGAAWLLMIAGLSLYSYHLTGSLRPDAMYETEGGASPWRMADALQSMRAYPFDRIWGFLPHAPVYLLAIPGWLIALRLRSKPVILAALLTLSLVLPSSGHGFTGAGATPLRHLVAVVPLAVLPLGLTLAYWRGSRSLRVAFAILLVLSVHAATSYNLFHRKEVGRMVFAGDSGWAPNLLFPWTHGIAWAHWRGTFVLFAIWMAAAIALLSMAAFVRRRSDPAPPVALRHAIGGVAAFVVVASILTALGGEWVRTDYLRPLDGARRAAFEYALAHDRCRVCYSSFRGEIGRANVVADADHALTFAAVRDDVRTNEEAVFEATVRSRDGEGWGVLAIDLGDDQMARVDVLGTARVRHVYRAAGSYKVSVRYQPHDGAVRYGSAEVAVRPPSVALDEVGGLPAGIAAAPATERIARCVLTEGRLAIETASGATPSSASLIAWTGQGWRIMPETAAIVPGTWVGVFGSGPGWRTDPVIVRWPALAVSVGAPIIVFP